MDCSLSTFGLSSPSPPSTYVIWTREEDKFFEEALVKYPEDTPNRWHVIASLMMGKTAIDVENHYQLLVDDVMAIETGQVILPKYVDDEDEENNEEKNEENAASASRGRGRGMGRGRGRGQRTQTIKTEERKKGVPWTEEEHKRFLVGLQRFGRGDWRSIARQAVQTKTSTQVASHAQKFYARQLPNGKETKRKSIHDITEP